MGKHSRTSPLPSSRPYAPGQDWRLPSESTRVRLDAVAHAAPEVYSTDAAGQHAGPDSRQGLSDRFAVHHAVAQSSMPLEHLNGLQFFHVVHGGLPQNNAGLYHPGARGIQVNGSVASPDPRNRAQGIRTVVHEVGHHVENTASGRIAGGGRTEGMAENYADRHTPEFPVSHAGVTIGYKPVAAYDTHLPLPDSPVFNTSWDPTGEVNRKRYAKTRAAGTMPDED